MRSKPVGSNARCGSCLWYGTLGDNSRVGECQNSESSSYWNQGDDRGTLQIARDGEACRFYKSGRAFLGEDDWRLRWWERNPTALVRTGTFQLFYPLVLTIVFFYCVFRE